MVTIKNRFAELLAEKQRKTGQRLTYEDVSRSTGVAMSTLSAYANNKVRRFDAVTVEALISFFDCRIEDFFVIEDGNDEQGQMLAVAVA